MPYLVLINETELELADEAAVKKALADGTLLPESWIKDTEIESDWQTVAELFPKLVADDQKP